MSADSSVRRNTRGPAAHTSSSSTRAPFAAGCWDTPWKMPCVPLPPDGRYPIAAVFVEIAPDMVDVNVHPTKSEVKFTRDNEVHHAVSQAVKQAS